MKWSVADMKSKTKEIIRIEKLHRRTYKKYYSENAIQISLEKERVFRYIHNQDKINAIKSLNTYRELIFNIPSKTKIMIMENDDDNVELGVGQNNTFFQDQENTIKELYREIEVYCI